MVYPDVLQADPERIMHVASSVGLHREQTIRIVDTGLLAGFVVSEACKAGSDAMVRAVDAVHTGWQNWAAIARANSLTYDAADARLADALGTIAVPGAVR